MKVLEIDSDPLQEQPVLLTAPPSLILQSLDAPIHIVSLHFAPLWGRKVRLWKAMTYIKTLRR